MLCCVVLCCVVLCCVALHCVVLRCVALRCVLLCCVVLCCVVLCCIVLCCVVLCCVVLCCVVLCCVVLCYIQAKECGTVGACFSTCVAREKIPWRDACVATNLYFVHRLMFQNPHFSVVRFVHVYDTFLLTRISFVSVTSQTCLENEHRTFL